MSAAERTEIRWVKPRERCRINGHLCEVSRQARRTTFVRVIEGEFVGATVQLPRKQVVVRA